MGLEGSNFTGFHTNKAQSTLHVRISKRITLNNEWQKKLTKHKLIKVNYSYYNPQQAKSRRFWTSKTKQPQLASNSNSSWYIPIGKAHQINLIHFFCCFNQEDKWEYHEKIQSREHHYNWIWNLRWLYLVNRAYLKFTSLPSKFAVERGGSPPRASPGP